MSKVGQVKVLSNGAEGTYGADGKFRITKGASKAYLSTIQKSPKGKKALSPKAAARAFNRYYKNKSYKSEKSRASAKQRDLCHKKSPNFTTSLSAFRRSPRKYDYEGLDDGSKCPAGKKIVASKSPSAKALAALAAYRNSKKGGSKKRSQKKSQKRQH